MSSWLHLQYTLTETHVGGSGAIGATDLPIAREATTGFPFLPDTALKGVARDAGERLCGGPASPVVRSLFGFVSAGGPGRDRESVEPRSKSESAGSVGHLSFTQGHLLLYPLRAIERPFVYATCSLLLTRLMRLTAAYGIKVKDAEKWKGLLTDATHARTASERLAADHLVVEGLGYGRGDVAHDPGAAALATVVAGWFGTEVRGPTGKQIEHDLVVLPDRDFAQLVQSAPPVRARISLNENKTTTGGDGNLWYEEMLPSDCLFWSILSTREGAGNGEAARKAETAMGDLGKILGGLSNTQIGAGESTGHGRCWWWPAPQGA